MQMKGFLPEPRFPLEPYTVANGLVRQQYWERTTLPLLWARSDGCGAATGHEGAMMPFVKFRDLIAFQAWEVIL